jgi:ferredoxin
MKVQVDADRCRGHSLCCVLCPEVFTLSEDGYSTVTVAEVPAEFEEAVKEAAHVCPERAIMTS